MRRFWIILLLSFSSCKTDVVYDVSDAVYRLGDDITWAGSEYDDTGWNIQREHAGKEIFWVRFHLMLNQRNVTTPLGLQVNTFGAFEVYWDGTLIGRNGQIGTANHKEVPGTETSYFMVPDSLAKQGKHVVALRESRVYKDGNERGTGIKLEGYLRLLRAPLVIMSFMNLMAGAFLIAAIYYFFLFINSSRKEPAILIFSITCFLFFVLLILEYIKFYVDIPYTYFYTRLEAIGFLTFATSFLVPLYFTIQFSYRRKVLLISLLCIALVGIYIVNFRHYDFTAQCFSYAMWLAAMAVVLNAISRKEKGGWIVLGGLLLSAVVNYFLVYDFGLFISFTFIVLCMLYLHTIRAREVEKAHQASLLLSSRLRLELIKKNIQPHFIKNTLTSLIDWVEESPKQGAVFIQALADEFDIFNQIADATLIPVSKEIELCKTHLKVMQFRKEICYTWEESRIVPTDMLPPALIHTALENGITHSMPSIDRSIHFRLSFEQFKEYKQYTLLTIAQNRPAIKRDAPGAGFKYIEARLMESYGEKWEFHSEAVTEGWQTSFKIFV